ncbi:MAG TPA: isoprenylcysteine carboxylmethyltransferase family protein [Propionibacteriaceae bacterium]
MSAYFAAAAAAVLYGWGLVMLFWIRTRQHKAATGSSGFNGFTRTPGIAARVAGVCFAAAVILGLVAPLLAAFRLVSYVTGPAENWTTGPGVWVGLLLTAAGFTMAVVAQNTMGASWRIGVDQAERTELVTHGVFAHVRNPIFTAMIAAQLGTALMAPTWLSVTAVLLLLAACELQVRLVEEPHLARVHGNSYQAYSAGAGRFLPRLGRLNRQPTPLQDGSQDLVL